MGVAAAAWAAAAVGAASAAYGASENENAKDENAQRQQESKDDYQDRLRMSAKWAKKLQDQYNKLTKTRPNLKWDTYVRSQIKDIDDPIVREFYQNAKEQDFQGLQRLADLATTNNVQNLVEAADDISGGQWKQMMDKRTSLINNTNTAERFLRTNELLAPTRGDATTVKYDSEGRLVEGQRSDKQTFQTAYEVQAATEKEQLDNVRTFQNDILNAAQSQQQKASEFSSFYDPTGFATSLAAQQNAQSTAYQAIDESRAWDLYNMFAKSSAGITPSQPQYTSANPGDAMIKAGVEMGSSALTDYYKNQSNQKNQTATASTAKTTNTYG